MKMILVAAAAALALAGGASAKGGNGPTLVVTPNPVAATVNGSYTSATVTISGCGYTHTVGGVTLLLSFYEPGETYPYTEFVTAPLGSNSCFSVQFDTSTVLDDHQQPVFDTVGNWTAANVAGRQGNQQVTTPFVVLPPA